MTLPDIVTKQSNLTTVDTNQWTLADRLIDTNIWLQKIVGMILDSMDEADYDDGRRTDYPIKNIALTTNRDYQIPTTEKVLKLKNLTVCYDGVNEYRAFPIDSNETQNNISGLSTNATAQATIDNRYSRTAPKYDYKWGSLFLYPRATAADVTAGGYMVAEWYRQPTEFTLANMTDTSVVPGFDDTFHAMLAYGPAYEFCLSKGMPQAKSLYAELQIYEQRLRKQYSVKQGDRKYQLGGDYQSMK
jgi:hypothetical protein